MKWQCVHFDEMTNQQIWQMYHIRAETFCVQQHRTFVDADETDLVAQHVLGFADDGKLVAYARFYQEGDHCSFGRVLTVPAVRGQGVGQRLMEFLLAQIADSKLAELPMEITAQADKQGFYERFGFHAVGDVFIHEQTPHIIMDRK